MRGDSAACLVKVDGRQIENALEAAEPITTGNTGKMHGARTVRMPAKNETTRNAILFYFRKDRGQRCRIAELLY
jgi:hypothetical protein